jgi:hypothetical protein
MKRKRERNDINILQYLYRIFERKEQDKKVIM